MLEEGVDMPLADSHLHGFPAEALRALCACSLSLSLSLALSLSLSLSLALALSLSLLCVRGCQGAADVWKKDVWDLVATIHFSPFTCCSRKFLGVHSRALFARRTPNSRNHSCVVSFTAGGRGGVQLLKVKPGPRTQPIRTDHPPKNS